MGMIDWVGAYAIALFLCMYWRSLIQKHHTHTNKQTPTDNWTHSHTNRQTRHPQLNTHTEPHQTWENTQKSRGPLRQTAKQTQVRDILTHTQTQTRTQAHRRTHTHTHTHTETHTHKHTHTHTHTHTHRVTHVQTSNIHTHWNMNTHTQTHTETNKYTLRNTHSHWNCKGRKNLTIGRKLCQEKCEPRDWKIFNLLRRIFVVPTSGAVNQIHAV